MRRLLFLLLLPLILAIPRAGHAQIAANCNTISGNVGCIGTVTDNSTSVPNVNKIIVTGGSVANLGPGIAGITASGCTSNCSFTGTTTTAGISDTGGINTTAATAYSQNGVPLILAFPNASTNNASVLVGPGAGANLPADANFDTFVGWNSGYSYTGAGGAGEVSCFANGSCYSLSSTADHDTGLGVYSLHYATTEVATVSVGGDNMRNISGTNSNTSVGSYGMANAFVLDSASLGSTSLTGNAASILFGGTATNGDVETLTFTSGAISGGSTTVTYTVATGNSCAVRSAAIFTAITNSTALSGAGISAFAQDPAIVPCVIAISAPWTAAIGGANELTVTYSASGSATETGTITNGVVATDTRLNGIGYHALEGYRATTFSYLNCMGAWCMANATVMTYSNCLGDLCLSAATDSIYDDVVGANAFKAMTTGYYAAGIGYNIGAACTTCRYILALGPNAGSTTLTTANDIIFITDGSPCDSNTPDQMLVCGNGGTFFSVTGYNVVNQSATTIGGQLIDSGRGAVASTVSTTDLAQASGGTTLLAFAATTGMSNGMTVTGTSVPLGDTIASIVSTAQVSFATTSSSASGQAVISVTSTPAVATGQQCVDTTAGHTAYIGAGNVIASVSAGTSVTLTSNIVTTIPSGDTIKCDPVVTLATTTSAAVAAAAVLQVTTNNTALSALSSFVDHGDASVFGNMIVGNATYLPALGSDSGDTTHTVCVTTNNGLLFYGSGTAGICAGTSSKRFKTNIQSEPAGLVEVMAMKPDTFNYLPGLGYDTTKTYNGFMAEDLQQVLPDLVESDAQGRPKSVDMLGTIPVLVRAIQQQQAEIAELQNGAH